MKVFCCKNQWSYGGGLILVAANTKEEAYLTAAYDDKTSYLFDWADDDYMWCEPQTLMQSHGIGDGDKVIIQIRKK